MALFHFSHDYRKANLRRSQDVGGNFAWFRFVRAKKNRHDFCGRWEVCRWGNPWTCPMVKPLLTWMEPWRVMGWSCCNPLMYMEESPFPCVTEQHCPFWPRQFRCQLCERFFLSVEFWVAKKGHGDWCTCRICEANTVVGEYSLPMIGNTYPNGGFLIAILVYQKVTKNYPSPQPRNRHRSV